MGKMDNCDCGNTVPLKNATDDPLAQKNVNWI